MKEIWNAILSAYGAYFGGSAIFALSLAGMVYIFVTEEKKIQKWYLIWLPVCILFMIFMPVIMWVMEHAIHETDTYWRMFWLYPAGIILAYSGTRLIAHAKQGLKQGITLLAILAILILAGKWVGTGENYTRVHNAYKLPDEVIEVGQILEKQEAVYAVAPEDVACIIRLYNADIHMLYGRDLYRGWVTEESVLELSEILDMAGDNAERAVEIAKQYGVNYIVIYTESKEAYDSQTDCIEYIGGNELYSVYAVR